MQKDLKHIIKLPPQEVELEKAILGAMLLERDGLVLGIAEIQHTEVFYMEQHQVIFNAIKDLFSTAKPIDILTVVVQLRSKGQLEIAGGSFYVTELTTLVNSSANIQYHIQIVKQKWVQRLII